MHYMRHAVLSATVYLWVVGSAQAQLRVPLTVLAGAGSADIVSTFTSQSNHEDNPIVAWMNPHGLPATVAVGAVIEVAAVWGLCRWLCEKHSRIATALVYAGAGLHGSMAAKNWRNRERNRQLQHFGR